MNSYDQQRRKGRPCSMVVDFRWNGAGKCEPPVADDPRRYRSRIVLNKERLTQ